MEWISIYTDDDIEETGNGNYNNGNEVKSITLDDDFPISVEIPVGEVKRYGVWCEVDGKICSMFYGRCCINEFSLFDCRRCGLVNMSYWPHSVGMIQFCYVTFM